MTFIPLPVKVPELIKWYYNGYVWDKFKEVKKEKILYLTFDDGPIPEVTPWVLNTLKKFNAHATFFCIGDNIRKHPDVFTQLLKSDNRVGNHTYNHLKGWKTQKEDYIKNTLKAEEIIEKSALEGQKSVIFPKLLRPPYGKITRQQAKSLKAKDYEIIMYDVIAYDWDKSVSPEKCAENIIRNAKSGSILVFHDSIKAENNMKAALPIILKHYTEEGYTFKTL
tara:strand:+ start:14880 stop:15548 length:669 start_codon:yes stop_codon:yes gene_type:complete